MAHICPKQGGKRALCGSKKRRGAEKVGYAPKGRQKAFLFFRGWGIIRIQKQSMKLVIAIVQNEDNQKLNDALVKQGFRSTRLATSGGFLRTGNTTVMIGVEESKLEEVLGIIESVCKARKQTVSAVAPSVDTTGFYIPYPVEVSVGGATVYILDVEQFRRM